MSIESMKKELAEMNEQERNLYFRVEKCESSLREAQRVWYPLYERKKKLEAALSLLQPEKEAA